MNDNEQKYADIIYLPHHVSKKRKSMSMEDRAAQFSPFAALTGHDAAIRETARYTETQIELDDEVLAAINKKLQLLQNNLTFAPQVIITYFEPDDKKDGGSYVSVTGSVKTIDVYSGEIVLSDRTSILISDIVDIESELFSTLV